MKDIEKTLLNEFLNLNTWEKKYEKIIDLGKNLTPMNEADKKPELLVQGCSSAVWLKARLNEKGLVILEADSDSLIVKGLIALLILSYSEQSPDEILKKEPELINKIQLNKHLSPSRTNGLSSMLKQIKLYALAFKALKS